METKTSNKKDVYQLISDRIIKQLEKGVIPWKQNWSNVTVPTNITTLKPYRGVNILLLATLGYEQNYFLTLNQLTELGGEVKQDEKPYPVVYWKWEDGEKETEKAVGKKKSILRYYYVYNISQCDGIPENKIPQSTAPTSPIQACEELVFKMPNQAQIVEVADMPCYVLKTDVINLPAFKSFKNAETFYTTLFQELIHSTGHEKRLNRKDLVNYDKQNKKNYSVEELIGEIGACFLNALVGINDNCLQNNPENISEWLKSLQNDKHLIIYACTQAQKAVDYILHENTNEKY